jgi:hypothetical protein
MPLGTYAICIETPVGTPLAASISDIRLWLDRCKIEPVEFKSEIRDGVLTLDIRFRSQNEARLFERDFALV